MTGNSFEDFFYLLSVRMAFITHYLWEKDLAGLLIHNALFLILICHVLKSEEHFLLKKIQILTKSSSSSRLETRTKESTIHASV